MITLFEVANGYYPNFETHIHNFVNLPQELPCGFDCQVVSTEYFHRPAFTLKGDILSITYMNRSQSNVKISLEDSKTTYYKENLPGDLLIRKSFDLRNVSRGEYTVLFEVKGYKFANYITKE